MKAVARFEKVNRKQFNEAFDGLSVMDYDEIKLPHRATTGSAGYDFYSPISFVLEPRETIKFPTGIRCQIDDGYVLTIYPRSGLGFKYRLRLDNTVGIIDSDYYNSDNEGHIFVKITNDSNEGKSVEIKTGDAFDVKIDTRSYGDLHSIDVVSFGFNEDGTSTAGNKSTDLGLFLLANNKKAFTETTNLATRLANFQNLTNKVGKIKFSYKQNSSATEEEETLSVELNNIQTISDIRDAFSTAIATASSVSGYNGIFKNIKAVLVGDEIAFVSIDDEVGSSVSVGTTTVEADEIALYDVLYLNGATMTTGLGIKTAPVAGTNCSFEENQSIIDAIEVINSSKNDTVNIFFSNVNYSFKDIENIDKKLSGLENVTFLFVIRNALDSKYLQQYTSINDIKTGCVVVESNNVVDNECLARILTYWGSYDVSQQNTTRRFGDLIPLDITDANLSSNTQRMQEVANNGYVSCYFGKPQNQNVVGLFNNASSFGIFNVLYANYLRRLIVLSQFNENVISSPSPNVHRGNPNTYCIQQQYQIANSNKLQQNWILPRLKSLAQI